MSNEQRIELKIDATNLTGVGLDKARQGVQGFVRDVDGASGRTLNLGSVLRGATSLAGAFGLSLGVGTIVNFGKAVLDDADALTRLADKLGDSVEGLQELRYIGEQSGNELEQLTGAIGQMQKRLANGDDSAISALRGMGLELAEFLELSPSEQFMAIAREVGKVPDPLGRVKVATDLMGKAGAEVLPSLIADVDGLAAAAPKMSRATVAALDDVGDAIGRLWGNVKAGGGTALAGLAYELQNLPTFIADLARTGSIGMASAATTMRMELEASLKRELAKPLPTVDWKEVIGPDGAKQWTMVVSGSMAELTQKTLQTNAAATALTLTDDELAKAERTLTATYRDHHAASVAAAADAALLGQQLNALGLTTQTLAQRDLAGLQRQIAAAEGMGAQPLTRALILLRPELEALERRAQTSGVQVDGLEAALDRARQATAGVADEVAALDLALPTDSIGELIGATQSQTEQLDMQAVQARLLTDAYHHFGQQTPEELRKVAAAAEQHYRTIAASGTATTAQLEDAYAQMTEAQRAVSGQLARDITNDWRGRILPSVVGTLNQLQTSASGTFASMMLGAKSFKDGMLDLWGALKASAVRIFAEIADAWIGGMLKRMLAALAGNKQAFAGGFAGLFAGVSGGSSLPGLGWLGTGGGVPGASGSVIGPEMGPGTGPMAGGGANWGALAGGGMMAVGGLIGLWQAMQSGSKLGGLVSGASTGAGIGTMIAPGIGTAIGAGVGAIGGLIASLFGNKEYGQVKKSRGEFEGQFGGSAGMIDAVSKAYATLGRSGADAQRALKAVWDAKDVKSYERAVGVVQQALADANVKLEKQASLREAIAATERDISALQNTKASWADISALTEKYGINLDALGPKVQQLKITESATELLNVYNTITEAGGNAQGVLDGLADELSGLAVESRKYGVELPENLRAGIEALYEQGKLVDENGEKFTDLSGLKFGAPVVTEMDKVADALKLMTDRLEELIRELAGLETASIESSTAVRGHWSKAPWDDWATPEWPDLRGERDSGGGVKGYASGGLITSPHLAMVGEGHEPELIGPVSFMAEALAGALAMVGGGARASRIVNEVRVYLDGREMVHGMDRYGRALAEIVVPWVPETVHRYGIARR